MRACDIILKKRNGLEHTSEEINYLMHGYVNGDIPDYQLAAWAMAVYYQGLSNAEILCLTQAMIDSGDKIDLSAVEGVTLDKHSTGGVADTTTLILVPLLAAADVKIVKMSGRGLGYTGGTIDKLEAIPGFRVEFNQKQIFNLIEKCGAVIAAQTNNLVPADKKLYALRDVTATIDIIPLIASSIMAKKIATGTEKILLDVKVGQGAFMKNLEDAELLAQMMVEIGNGMGRETVAFITNMHEPLGNYVGNSLEVKEAINVLTGRSKGRLRDLTLELAAEALVLVGKFDSNEYAKNRAQMILESGRATKKFMEIIANQGGNPKVVDNPEILPQASQKNSILANENGFIKTLDAEKIGMSAMILGAGRSIKEQDIFQEVGISLKKKVGDTVNIGDELAVIHSRAGYQLEAATKLINAAISYTSELPIEQPLIYKKIIKNR